MKSLRVIINSVGTKQLIIYACIAIACVIVIGLAVFFLFFYSSERPVNISDIDGSQQSEKTQIEQIKTEFNSTFTNSIRMARREGADIEKIDDKKDLVYTMYQINLSSENNYELNLNLPVININTETAKGINKEIDKVFGEKANFVVQARNVQSIYNVDYIAYLKDDILSLVIKATLKELDYAQRVIIRTYNYNVKTGERVTLGNLLSKKNLDKNYVYNKVIEEINEVIRRNRELSKLGYELFNRNSNSNIYLPENTTTFFMDLNDKLYLIYPYGNNNFTSEIDIIIF